MPVNVIGTLKPKNNGKFPVAEAADIKVTDDLRLDEALENKADIETVNFAVSNKADKNEIVYITPQMFGAAGDGVTDDTAAFIAAINSANGVIFIPKGTYIISQTLFINRSMTIQGESRYDTKIKYTGEGYLFDVSTNANEVAKITNFAISSDSDNYCVKCEIENHWGSSVTIDNVDIFGFSIVFDFVSAFGCMIQNTRILSNGVIKFRPFSTSEPSWSTFCNQNTLQNVYYTGYPDNTPIIIEASNCRGLALNSCTFEKADLFISYVNESRNIVVNECWFEKITQFESKSDNSRNLWINATVMPEVSRMGEDDAPFSGLSRTGQYSWGYDAKINGAQVLREIYNYNQSLLSYYISNTGYDPTWVYLFQMKTSGITSRIPYNITVRKVSNESELGFDLREFYYHINAAAMCEIDVVITYSDTSILWFRKRVLMVNASSFRNGISEIYQKDNWGKAQTMDATTTIENGVFKYSVENDTPLQIAFIIHDIPLGNNI